MDIEQLIALGNQARTDNNPELALQYYAQAFTHDRLSASAFNNYGNVLRECGDPMGGIPFLMRSIQLAPEHPTAQFNLAVAFLKFESRQRVGKWKRCDFKRIATLLGQLLSRPRCGEGSSAEAALCPVWHCRQSFQCSCIFEECNPCR